MVINTIGLIVGILILIGGLYYLIKEKNDPESKKIYGTAAAAGAIVAVIFVVRLFL